MALKDEVIKRIPNQYLVNLTRPDPTSTSATTINSSLLTTVSDDVTGDFEVFGCIALDSTKKTHVTMAMQGVILKLLLYKGDDATVLQKHMQWQSDLKAHLRMITFNDRIKPKSSSKLSPAKEQLSESEVRPWFDVEETHDDLVPEHRDVSRRTLRGGV